jgi:3-deoxy-D-manno-octulosonate 8-phosphate phosphatase (KDO 8-P phosphatase)
VIDTLYQPISDLLFNQFKQTRLLVCDVDGVLSNGFIYLTDNREEIKTFNAKDGFGIRALQRIGVEFAVITGRESNIVLKRMESLGVKHIFQGIDNKRPAIESLQAKLGISQQQTACVGDDVPDFGLFVASEVKVAVCDAHPTLLNAADYITQKPGGLGAVREVCDLILQAQGQLDDYRGRSQ